MVREMATIAIQFINGGNTITGALTVSDANATRILTAHRALMGTTNNQETLNMLIARYLAELIGNTKTVERNANAIVDIPVSP